MAVARDRAEKLENRAALRQALRHEGFVQVGPRLHDLERLERRAFAGRTQRGTAAERDPPGAHLVAVDRRVRRQPGLAQPRDVQELSRAERGEEPARLPVAAEVGRQSDVAVVGKPRGDRVDRLTVAADPVEEHDRRPWPGSVREVERRRDPDPVVHGHELVGLRERGVAGRCQDERRKHGR